MPNPHSTTTTLPPKSTYKRRSIAYIEGYKYQLVEQADFYVPALAIPMPVSTQWVFLSTAGLLTIKAGYAWDGCSGPTYDSRNTMPGSVFHDAGYQLIRLELLAKRFKNVIDAEFHKILLEDGVWSTRARYYHAAVDTFGLPSTLPSRKKQVLYAP